MSRPAASTRIGYPLDWCSLPTDKTMRPLPGRPSCVRATFRSTGWKVSGLTPLGITATLEGEIPVATTMSLSSRESAMIRLAFPRDHRIQGLRQNSLKKIFISSPRTVMASGTWKRPARIAAATPSGYAQCESITSKGNSRRTSRRQASAPAANNGASATLHNFGITGKRGCSTRVPSRNSLVGTMA